MTKQLHTTIMLLAYAPLLLCLTWVTNVAIVANAVRHWDDVKTGTGACEAVDPMLY